MHIDFNEQQVPNTILLKFRHMLDKNRIGKKIFANVNRRLDEVNPMMHRGTIVNASLYCTEIGKNQEGKHDPEIHQTKKGNKRYF